MPPSALQYASVALKNSSYFVLDAVTSRATVLFYAPDALRKTFEFVRMAVKLTQTLRNTALLAPELLQRCRCCFRLFGRSLSQLVGAPELRRFCETWTLLRALPLSLPLASFRSST